MVGVGLSVEGVQFAKVGKRVIVFLFFLFSADRTEGKGGDEHAMSSCSVTEVWPALGECTTNDGDDDGAWVAVAGAECLAKEEGHERHVSSFSEVARSSTNPRLQVTVAARSRDGDSKNVEQR